MNRISDSRQIRNVLQAHRQQLRRMGVRSLALFGSAARDALRAESDIDLLVSFASPPGFRGYMQVKFYLEEVLGRPVDLVMEGAVALDERGEMLRRELVHVA